MSYKVGQTWKNKKGEIVIIHKIYESRITKIVNIQYSKKHDLGSYGDSIREDIFFNVIEGMEEVKQSQGGDK